MATRKVIKISEATRMIAAHVRATNEPVSTAIRNLWPRLGQFTPEDVAELIQEGLALRTSPLLTRPILPADVSRVVKGTAVTIRPYRTSMTKIEISVKILDDIIYHVNGAAKPIAQFTLHDVETKLGSTRAIREGVERHEAIWAEAFDLLQSEGKDIIANLSPDAQQVLVERVVDARQVRGKLPEAVV